MRRVLAPVLRVLGYLAFQTSFAALALASTGLGSRWGLTFDRPAGLPPAKAVVLDVGLLLAFGLQHSTMARPGFKRWMTRWVPDDVERSVYVLASSLCLALVVLCWAGVEGDLWDVQGPGAWAILGAAFLGYGLAFWATFAFGHFAMFGLTPTPAPSFRMPLLYQLVRHPMMLGLLVAVWAAPRMTVGHAVLSAGMSFYIWVGMFFEERGLLRDFGDQYRRYQAKVPKLLPWPRPVRHPANGFNVPSTKAS